MIFQNNKNNTPQSWRRFTFEKYENGYVGTSNGEEEG